MTTLTRAESQLPYCKPARLIENATSRPVDTIHDVYQAIFLDELRDNLLPKWLRVALINDNGIYSNADQRSMLLEFYDQLLILLEALLVYSKTSDNLTTDIQIGLLPKVDHPILLTSEQIANPLQVIHQFRKQFDHEDIRRELWYFVEAGVNHNGDYPTGFNPGSALMTYDYVNCLVEAAYSIGD